MYCSVCAVSFSGLPLYFIRGKQFLKTLGEFGHPKLMDVTYLLCSHRCCSSVEESRSLCQLSRLVAPQNCILRLLTEMIEHKDMVSQCDLSLPRSSVCNILELVDESVVNRPPDFEGLTLTIFKVSNASVFTVCSHD